MSYGDCIDWLESCLLPCGVRELTGWYCPGCGLQTALVALLRGDLWSSLSANPALLPVIGLFFYTALHLKVGFRRGPSVILGLFLLSATLMIVNYLARFVLLR